MKVFVAILLAFASALAFCQEGILGTKTSATPSSVQSGGGIGSLAQMLIALVIVALVLKWVLPKLATRLNKKLVTTSTGGIVVEESAQFAGGSLYIVRARKKALLLSVGASGVTFLTDLTEPEPDLPTFGELLEETPAVNPEKFAAVVVETPLDRLDRFLAS